MKSTGRHKIGHLFMEELFSSWPWVILVLLEVLFEQTVVVTCWVTGRQACRRGQAYLLAEGTMSMLGGC